MVLANCQRKQRSQDRSKDCGDTVRIPHSVRTVEQRAFFDNRLHTVIIENGVQRVGDQAFAGSTWSCNPVTRVLIGDSVSLGQEIFLNTGNFLSVYNWRQGEFMRESVSSFEWVRVW
jgi:hypothetical protein